MLDIRVHKPTCRILVLVRLVARMLVNKMRKIKIQQKVKNVNLKCSGIKLFNSIYTANSKFWSDTVSVLDAFYSSTTWFILVVHMTTHIWFADLNASRTWSSWNCNVTYTSCQHSNYPELKKKHHTWFLPIISANIDWFSKFFHSWTQQQIDR